MTTFTHVPEVPTTVDINKVTSYIPDLGVNREMVEFNFSGSYKCSPQVPFTSFVEAINTQKDSVWRMPHNVVVANAVYLEFSGKNNEFVTIFFYSWNVRLAVRDIQIWIDGFNI